MLYYRGELTPANKEAAANLFSHRWLCKTFMSGKTRRNAYLTSKWNRNASKQNRWEWDNNEKFIFTSERPHQSATHQQALGMIQELKELIQTGAGKELDLHGFILLTIEGFHGVFAFHLQVEGGEVTYREIINSENSTAKMTA